MIKAKELRIGNLVRVCNSSRITTNRVGTHIEVENIYYNGINVSSGYEGAIETDFVEENIEGIPLTPEILSACGFISFRTNKEMTLTVPDNQIEQSINITCYDRTSDIRVSLEATDRDSNYTPQYVSIPLHISYLHQLQNLYFSLTGMELEIKKLETVAT